mgnify:FL=1
MIRLGVFSVVPSPYQRDLFGALATHPEVDLSVYYQSPDSVDNPWPEADLHAYEALLDGRRVSYGAKRAYINWSLPDLKPYDLVVLNTSYVSTAPQWLMRTQLKNRPWMFWGERMREQSNPMKRAGQHFFSDPLKEADAIACIGSLGVASYRARFPNQTLYNIPYHCDLSSFREAAQQPSGHSSTVEFLCCGQMIYRKGVDLLLRAFDGLVQEGLPVRLRLVGREADLPEMLRDLSEEAKSRIEFIGFQSPNALPSLFAQSDVFVLPSRHDGWGVVVNQALGSGLPMICSDAVGAAHDLILSEENGVRVPAGQVGPLREQMRRLATQPDVRSAWGERSAELVDAWTPEAGAQRWVDAIKDVLANRMVSS